MFSELLEIKDTQFCPISLVGIESKLPPGNSVSWLSLLIQASRPNLVIPIEQNMRIKQSLNALFRVLENFSLLWTTDRNRLIHKLWAIHYFVAHALWVNTDKWMFLEHLTHKPILTLKDHKLRWNSWVEIHQACQKVKKTLKISFLLDLKKWEFSASGYKGVLFSQHLQDWLLRLSQVCAPPAEFPLQEQGPLFEGIPKCFLHVFTDLVITVEILCVLWHCLLHATHPFNPPDHSPSGAITMSQANLVHQ